MASSLLLVLFNVCLLLTLFDFVLSKNDLINSLSNDKPNLQLSVHPQAGSSTENIEVRCEISQPISISPLSSSKFDNIYLSVKTDNVKPSGILLMFDDSIDRCLPGRENVQIDFCNASLIIIHINHTILNETLQKIDYKCWKGSASALSSYRIINRSARYLEAGYNSSTSLSSTCFLLLFVLFITQIITDIQSS